MEYADLKVGMVVKTTFGNFAIIENNDTTSYRLAILPQYRAGQIITKSTWKKYVEEIYYTNPDGKVRCEGLSEFRPFLYRIANENKYGIDNNFNWQIRKIKNFKDLLDGETFGRSFLEISARLYE